MLRGESLSHQLFCELTCTFCFVLFSDPVVPFITVMTALQFPKIMEFLPILLPRHFKWLISSGSKELLEKIEEMLGTHPWKLGFSKVSKTFTRHLIILSKGGFLKRDNFYISFKGKKFVWTSMLIFLLRVRTNYKFLIPVAHMQKICEGKQNNKIDDIDIVSNLII